MKEVTQGGGIGCSKWKAFFENKKPGNARINVYTQPKFSPQDFFKKKEDTHSKLENQE
jgi:hypothetical protein